MSTLIAFPEICPSGRSIELGGYPVRRFTSMAGTGVSRIYGSQPTNSRLQLTFQNISDAKAALITKSYENASGPYKGLDLPTLLWKGMSIELRTRLERDYTWRFSGPPQITSVKPGYSTVTVNLDGLRDG